MKDIDKINRNKTGVNMARSLAVALVCTVVQLLLSAGPVSADSGGLKRAAALVPLRAGKINQYTYVAPRARAAGGKAAPRSAVIDVQYQGFSAQAQAAFQYAVEIWESILTSPVPIKIRAIWEPLGSNILGQAGPYEVYSDFTNAPEAHTWYPIALANKLAGRDLDAFAPDITAQFSSNFSNWYFGTDGNTPHGMYDFASVVLHELGHGLGFLGSMEVLLGRGIWGRYPYVYDLYTVNGAGEELIDTTVFPRYSYDLGSELTGGAIFFAGPYVLSAAQGAPVRLYAPDPWEMGSSYSHLDEDSYPAGDIDSLMTPVLNPAEAVHSPGPVTLAIFKDMGWTVADSGMIEPDVKINDSDGPLSLGRNQSLTVTVELAANGNQDAVDIWMVASSPSGVYSYDADNNNWRAGLQTMGQGTLSDIPVTQVFSGTGLPAGTYIFYFGVDSVMNGSLDIGQATYDSATVKITQ